MFMVKRSLPAVGLSVLGAVLIALLYQFPARHIVDIGGYDAGYVRGFHDPQQYDRSMEPYLAGSDGRVRWSRGQSYLIFPQAGLPADITLRLRGWRGAGEPLPTVQFWLNGKVLVGSIQTDGTWQDYLLRITSGQDKLDDVVLELRSDTTTLAGEDRTVGVLVDRVVYEVSPGVMGQPGQPVQPYLLQVVYGGVALVLLWYLLIPHPVPRRRWAMLALGAVLIGGLFLCCYRWQPPLYPYPIRWLLPMLNALLFGVVIIRDGPALLKRWHWLPNVAVGVGVVGWGILVLSSAEQHVTLSVPGVEKDFRVFATRATSLEQVFQADGFYNLGYPLLLWLTHTLTDGNVFVAARYVAVVSGGILLLSGYWLAHMLLSAPPVSATTKSGQEIPDRNAETQRRRDAKHRGKRDTHTRMSAGNQPGTSSPQRHQTNEPRVSEFPDSNADWRGVWAGLVVLVLATSPLVVQYALYVGSDMPFAALVALSLALFLWGMVRDSPSKSHLLSSPPAPAPVPGRGGTNPSLLPLAGTGAGMNHGGMIYPLANALGSLYPLALAGAAAGGAFLMRHLGMVLLVWGGVVLIITVVLEHLAQRYTTRREMVRDVIVQSVWRVLPFVAGFVLVAMPQLIVNMQQTGDPLYSQQAKNIWLAVYGDIDWGRWGEVPDSIPLSEVVLRDPPRFLANWWGNVTAFVGSGAEDTSEFGRAIQLRLLGFPANWLAIVGLCGWLLAVWRGVIGWGIAKSFKQRHATDSLPSPPAPSPITGRGGADSLPFASMLLVIVAYVAVVSLAFVLQRFFLPLVVVYAVAAVWLLQQVVLSNAAIAYRWVMRGALVVGMLVLVVLHGGFTTGTRAVLDKQPADEVAIVQQTLALLQAGERVVVRVDPEVPLAKYSALAHRTIPWREGGDPMATLAWARGEGAAYLLWDTRLAPPPIPGEAAVVAGRYALYRLDGVTDIFPISSRSVRTIRHTIQPVV